MSSWISISELKESYRTLGARKFWIMTTSLLVVLGSWAGLGIWLESKVGWPEGYGFRCQVRDCLIGDMWHSPALLEHPGPFQIGLFMWIWSMPALLLVALTYAKLKKRRERTFL